MSPSGDLGPARITSSRRQTSDVSWSKPATDAPNLRMASDVTRRPQPRLKWTREGLALVSPRRVAAPPLPTDADAATRQRFVGRALGERRPGASRSPRAELLAPLAPTTSRRAVITKLHSIGAPPPPPPPPPPRVVPAPPPRPLSWKTPQGKAPRPAAAAAAVAAAAPSGWEGTGGVSPSPPKRTGGRAPAVGSGGLGPPSPSPRPSPAAPASPRPAAGDGVRRSLVSLEEILGAVAEFGVSSWRDEFAALMQANALVQQSARHTMAVAAPSAAAAGRSGSEAVHEARHVHEDGLADALISELVERHGWSEGDAEPAVLLLLNGGAAIGRTVRGGGGPFVASAFALSEALARRAAADAADGGAGAAPPLYVNARGSRDDRVLGLDDVEPSLRQLESAAANMGHVFRESAAAGEARAVCCDAPLLLHDDPARVGDGGVMVRSNHKWRSVEGDVYCILSQRWVPSPSTDIVPAAAAPAESVFAIREGAVRAVVNDADAAEAGDTAAVAPHPTLRSAVLMCDGATPQYALPPNTRLEVVRIDPSPSVATFQRWRRFTHAVHGEVVADRRETTADGTPTLYRVDRGDDGAVTGYMIVSESHVRRGHKLREIGYDGAATFTKRMRRRLVTLAPSFVPPDAHTGGGGGGGAGDGGGAGGGGAGYGSVRMPASGGANPSGGFWRCKPGHLEASQAKAASRQAKASAWLDSIVDA